MGAINLLFTQPPGADSDFIEAEDDAGRSVRIGEWREDEQGRWLLRITDEDLAALH